jgi:hypothetical protein
MAGGRFIGEQVNWSVAEAADWILAEILGGAAAWGILGLVLGIPQWRLLRGHIRSAVWWVPTTVVAWAVVGSLKWGQGPLMDAILFGTMDALEEVDWMIGPVIGIGLGIVFEGLTGLVVGTAQWLVLQRQLRNAGKWVLINVVGWAMNVVILGGLDLALGGLGEDTMFWVVAVAGGIVPGLITATGLVWLFARQRRSRW